MRTRAAIRASPIERRYSESEPRYQAGQNNTLRRWAQKQLGMAGRASPCGCRRLRRQKEAQADFGHVGWLLVLDNASIMVVAQLVERLWLERVTMRYSVYNNGW